jgi:hypothetical protein
MSKQLAFSPLTEYEIYDRLDKAGAEYAAVALFVKHRITAPGFIGDHTPSSMASRERWLASIEARWLELDDAKTQRLFQGRLSS